MAYIFFFPHAVNRNGHRADPSEINYKYEIVLNIHSKKIRHKVLKSFACQQSSHALQVPGRQWQIRCLPPGLGVSAPQPWSSPPRPSQRFIDCPISMADKNAIQTLASGDELCHFHFSAQKDSSLCVPVNQTRLVYNFFPPELS